MILMKLILCQLVYSMLEVLYMCICAIICVLSMCGTVAIVTIRLQPCIHVAVQSVYGKAVLRVMYK